MTDALLPPLEGKDLWAAGAVVLGWIAAGWLAVTHMVLRRELRRLVSVLESAAAGDVLARFHSRLPVIRALAATGNRLVRRLHDLESDRRREELRRRQFLAGVSHDLRTPLAAVLGYLEAVHTTSLDEAMRRRYLETALAKARELQRTLDRFFEWARLELDVADLPMTRINLAEQLRQVLIEFYPTLARRGVGLDVQLPDEAWVRAHPDLVTRVVRNLVQNALRHAQGLTLLAVRLDRRDGAWHLTVADDGAPLPNQVWADLQVSLRRGPGSPGGGLGLPISRQLARAWGGDLTVEPRPHRGLLARVTWPASPPPSLPATRRR